MTRWFIFLFIALLIACADDPVEVTPSPTVVVTEQIIAPTATAEPEITPTSPPRQSGDSLLIAMDVPDRTGLFADFDSNGAIVGLDVDVMSAISAAADLTHEQLITPYTNALDSLRAGEIDATIARIEISENAPAGIAYTDPYLEVGQIMVVRANEEEIETWRDISADQPLAVVANEYGMMVASDTLNHPVDQIITAPTTTDALQMLSDFEVRAAIINSLDAEAYTDRYYQRLKVIGEGTPDYWIAKEQFGIAVAVDNRELLDKLNSAIFEYKAADQEVEIATRWLASDSPIDAGESLIGTPDDRLLVGVVGSEVNFDPADSYDRISHEVQLNTLRGLVKIESDGTIVADLAEGLPEISAAKTTYTFTLRDGLTFPDGSELSATVLKNSMMHVASTGNILYNVLKDANLDGFADQDAITVIDERTIQFTLTAPAGHFLARLATPAFSAISPLCNFNDYDPVVCVGIAPYQVSNYEAEVAVSLIANESYFDDPPPMKKIELRLYPTSRGLANALEIEAVDVVWQGLSDDDLIELLTKNDYTFWEGAGIFKSYLVFEQSEPPWDDVRVRQAVALSVDRTAISREVFEGLRVPLASPLVDGSPGQIAVYPERDLEEAIRLLQSAGYSASNPVEVEFWYLNDGRYTDLEDEYATAIAAQLEETGIFDVTLNGQSWGIYSGQMFNCNYQTFLLGWPPSNATPYLDGLNWTYYFILNAETLCSNYESEKMDDLFEALFEATTQPNRAAVFAEIQQLWAEELPTLDLYQDLSEAVSLSKVTRLEINPLGFLRYDSLMKE